MTPEQKQLVENVKNALTDPSNQWSVTPGGNSDTVGMVSSSLPFGGDWEFEVRKGVLCIGGLKDGSGGYDPELRWIHPPSLSPPQIQVEIIISSPSEGISSVKVTETVTDWELSSVPGE